MTNILEYIFIGLRLLYKSLLFFFFSYITIFISIATIKLVDANNVEQVLNKPEIILSFLATIPTYLIGIHYMLDEDKKDFKDILLIFIILSIALFGIVFNVKTIKDMDTVVSWTYIMLGISLLLTFFAKFRLKEFKDDVKRQKDANSSRKKEEVSLPSGKTISIKG